MSCRDDAPRFRAAAPPKKGDHMTKFDDLKLYILPGCPYCAKVDRFLDEHDLSVEHLDVTEGTNGDDLIRIGGKRQCPCLLIDGRPLYESDDIVDYLAGRISA